MPQTVLYKLDKPLAADPSLGAAVNGFRVVLWKPSFGHLVPPGKGRKYCAYWLFHFLRIFRNRDYSAVLVYTGETLASSLLVVPAYYKWPFMGKDDVQLAYVLTRPDYRGKGLAERAVRLAIQKNQQDGRTFWYVTNTENVTSRNLCEKVGFEFVGFGEKTRCFLKLVD